MSIAAGTRLGPYEPGAPRRLFPFASLWNYQGTGDGRFLVGRRSLNPDAPALSVVLNWQRLLP
jgi:hypothetical protein